ncbi:MAG TPA: hypothetical protein VF762_00245 [Blastocatellia bacterium]|jgi:hypothetical protein
MAISLINTECKRYGCIKNLLACYANCRYSTRCDDLRNEIINNTEQASSDINKYLSERGKTPIIIQLMKRGLKFSENTSPVIRPANKGLPGPDKKLGTETPAVTVKSIATLAKEIVPEVKPPKLPTIGVKNNRKKSSKLGKTRFSKSKELNTESAMAKLSRPRGPSFLEKPPAILSEKKVARHEPRSSKIKKRSKSVKRPARALEPVSIKSRESTVMPRRPKNDINATVADKEQVLNTPAREQEVTASHKTMTTGRARPKKRSAVTRARAAERNGKVYIILDGKSASVVDEQGLMAHLFTNPSSSAKYYEASEVEARVQIIKK